MDAERWATDHVLRRAVDDERRRRAVDLPARVLSPRDWRRARVDGRRLYIRHAARQYRMVGAPTSSADTRAASARLGGTVCRPADVSTRTKLCWGSKVVCSTHVGDNLIYASICVYPVTGVDNYCAFVYLTC